MDKPSKEYIAYQTLYNHYDKKFAKFEASAIEYPKETGERIISLITIILIVLTKGNLMFLFPIMIISFIALIFVNMNQNRKERNPDKQKFGE